MYDVYLYSSRGNTPDVSDLTADLAHIVEAEIQPRLQSKHPGFLGLAISHQDALTLLKKLRTAKADGLIVPSAYHQPRIDVDTALGLAEQAITVQQRTHFPKYMFGPIRLLSEEPMWWKFGAVSEELVQQGYIPGTIFACIDKLDGHVWQSSEFQELFSETA